MGGDVQLSDFHWTRRGDRTKRENQHAGEKLWLCLSTSRIRSRRFMPLPASLMNLQCTFFF